MKPLAEQGNAQAQYNLGVVYEDGWGVTIDGNEAVKWYRKSAEQGHAEAQSKMGMMYTIGKGVTPDRKEAVRPACGQVRTATPDRDTSSLVEIFSKAECDTISRTR